jgi:hypothetical protein
MLGPVIHGGHGERVSRAIVDEVSRDQRVVLSKRAGADQSDLASSGGRPRRDNPWSRRRGPNVIAQFELRPGFGTDIYPVDAR